MKKLRQGILCMALSTTLLYAEEPASSGRQLYVTNCLVCHGNEGLGDGPLGQGLHPEPRNLTQRPYKYGCGPGPVFRTITFGIEGTGMPAFGKMLTESERKVLADYVFQLGRRGGCNCK